MCICCIMAFSSCFKQIEVVEVEGFSNVELSLKGITSDMVVRIYNPNPIPFNIKSADIILSVGDILAGDLVLDESVKLSSRDTTEVILKLVSRKGAIVNFNTIVPKCSHILQTHHKLHLHLHHSSTRHHNYIQDLRRYKFLSK